MTSIHPLHLIFRAATPLVAAALVTASVGCAGSTATTKTDSSPLHIAGPVESIAIDASTDAILGVRSALNPKDGSFYQAFVLEGRAGDVVNVTAHSNDFDAHLSLFTEDGNLLASNDDLGPGTTDARVISRLPRQGRYWIIVSALEPTTQGRFTLEVTSLHTATPVDFPGSLSTWLFPSGTRHPETQAEVMPFALNLEASQIVQIRAETENFPASITIVDKDTNRIVGKNSQGQNATSLRLEPGDYEILIGSYYPNLNGPFDLTVDFVDAELSDEILVGGTIDGLLGAHQELFPARNTPAQPFSFTLDRKSGADIHLESDEFDAFLVLTDAQGRPIAENDDFAQSTNARLFVNLEPGTYTIWAQAFDADQAGFFRLSVELFESEDADAIGPGQSLKGILDAAGEVHPERGSFFRSYALEIEEDQAVQIDLSSTDFDAYLILTDASGTVLEENDDRESGTLDAQIRRELSPGLYHVIVTGLDRSHFGRFNLEVRPR